mmetsp:Transcript_22497/g.58758  ORF Transcript_22497/g.58758 Transcript_22497/m.58758 type:complete len:84 (+) Transcript_22497:878-1129(+)
MHILVVRKAAPLRLQLQGILAMASWAGTDMLPSPFHFICKRPECSSMLNSPTSINHAEHLSLLVCSRLPIAQTVGSVDWPITR